MTNAQSPVLLPSQFMPQKEDTRSTDAYEELVANYISLKAKMNPLLSSQVETIRFSEVVDLRRNYIGAVGLQAVTSLLVKNDKLKELIVPCSGLNNDSVAFFCRAMIKHRSLEKLDFSGNTISLTAGLAVLSLLQHNPGIVHADLSNTQVPEGVMKKIEKALERNRLCETAGNASGKEVATREECAEGRCAIEAFRVDAEGNRITGTVVEEKPATSTFASTMRETVRKADWMQKETVALDRLSTFTKSVVASGNKFVPLPHIESGWRLLEVAILAPPFIFHSETELLLNRVFPLLNEEFVGSRVHLNPLFSPPEEPAGVCLKNLRFAIQVDVLRDVEKSRFLTLELIGDREGDYRAMTANDMLNRQSLGAPYRLRSMSSQVVPSESPQAPPLQPVLHAAHRRAMEVSSWRIIATRKGTRKLGIPPSLAPLLTEEPPIEHPDYLQRQVRRTCTVAAKEVCPSQLICCDAAVKEKKWQEHQVFKQYVVEGADTPELVIPDYNAEFDRCGADGQVHLKHLEEFCQAVYERIQRVMSAHFPPVKEGHPSYFYGSAEKEKVLQKLKQYHEWLHTLLFSRLHCHLVKKNITNRLDLYVIAPPSRNSLLLHSADISAVSELISSFTWGLLTKSAQKCRVAYHTTHSALLTEEPTELRNIICTIIHQLYPNQEVYRSAIGEVDLGRLQKLFLDTITEKGKMAEQLNGNGDAKSDGNEKVITVVILDGIDNVIAPVEPCTALRMCEKTGKDVWEAPALRPGAFACLPYCLSRNVRLVLGCETDSTLYKQLQTRGKDSVEFLPVGNMTPNDFDDMLRPEVMGRIGVTLSDDDFMLIRQKEQALCPEYVLQVVDVLRSFNEAPGLGTHAIKVSLPGTVDGMVQQVYDKLNDSFGTALIRKCTRLLVCSRWGIHEPQLRAMLQLTCTRFNRLIRMMRPLIYSGTVCNIGTEGGNALNVRVCIRSRAFRELIKREDVLEEGSESDYKVWHGMLLRCYHDVVHEVLGREKGEVLLGLSSTNPFERTAVKELPYHAVEAQEAHVIHRVVLTMPYLMVVYRNSLGYHLVRELISAFNSFHESYEVGEYTFDEDVDVTTRQKPTSILRLRDYIYFLRQYNSKLTKYPHLVVGTAIESGNRYPYVSMDARAYVTQMLTITCPLRQRRLSFFTTMALSAKKQIHQRTITACCIPSRGKRIITASADRSICAVHPVTGAVEVQVRRSPSAVESLLWCETGAYHATVCHDRTLLIYDSAEMNIVSRCDGGTFGAPLTSVAFSARGRFYLVTTEDLYLRAYDTEKTSVVLDVDQRHFLEKCEMADINRIRGFTTVLPHRSEDEIFYSVCHNVVIMWQLSTARNAFEKERTFSLPFSVESGKMIRSCTHFLLYPAPFPPTASGHLPPPRQLRLCDVEAGREVAVLVSSCNHVVYQLSSNERMVAAGLEDGSVAVYRLPWSRIRQVGDAAVDVLTVTPTNHFSAFRYSALPTVSGLRFKWGDDGIFALGNDKQLKFWVLPRKHMPFPVPDDDTVDEMQGESIELMEEEPEDEVIEGVADAEFVHECEITAWDVATEPSDKAAAVVIGDPTGRLTMLRMWSPAT
ncbi:hypothetical protein, conserved [Trypanosoma brucei brucei TREU927]|uniref:Flagellar Member 5 n=1 Tax=Trypanosoma brucei brucei (strain 927/4 GUTat10.1) TaxID=185431 RepID=Q38D82_TRYB2|nr:hypothetical protein, conserved [Trypanosoma brucei brucei TREU927]EAN77238.1 hypothetical protein, conserved [Trypanosoma brucei brucei TREU927]